MSQRKQIADHIAAVLLGGGSVLDLAERAADAVLALVRPGLATKREVSLADALARITKLLAVAREERDAEENAASAWRDERDDAREERDQAQKDLTRTLQQLDISEADLVKAQAETTALRERLEALAREWEARGEITNRGTWRWSMAADDLRAALQPPDQPAPALTPGEREEVG